MFVQLGVWWLSFSLSVNSQAEIVYDSGDIDDWSDWSKSGDTQTVNFNCPPGWTTSQTYCINMWGPSSMSQSLSLEGFHHIEIQIVFEQSVSNGEFCQIVYYNDALPGWSDPVFQLTNGEPVAENVMVSLPNDNTVNNQPVFQIKLENTGNSVDNDVCSVGKIIIYGIPITFAPTITPTMTTIIPTNIDTINPTFNPITSEPTAFPTLSPTVLPATLPTILPTIPPTILPTSSPSTMFPTTLPTILPTVLPTILPTMFPSYYPSKTPTDAPASSQTPSQRPSNAPTNGGQQHVQDFSTTIFESAQDDFESVDANFAGLIAFIAGLIVFIAFVIGIVYCYRIKTKNAMNKKNQDSMEMVDVGQTVLPISKLSSLSSVNSDSDVVCTHGNTYGNTPPNTAVDNTNNLDDREAGENDVQNGNGTYDELFYEGDNDDMYTVASNHDTAQHPTPQNNMNVTPQYPLDNDENYDTHGMYTKGNV